MKTANSWIGIGLACGAWFTLPGTPIQAQPAGTVADAVFSTPTVPAPAKEIPPAGGAPANLAPVDPQLQKRLDAIETRLGSATRPASMNYNFERRLADLEKRVQQLEQQTVRLQQLDQRVRRLEMK